MGRQNKLVINFTASVRVLICLGLPY